MSALWGMMACVLFTGGVIGWHWRAHVGRRRGCSDPNCKLHRKLVSGFFDFDDR